MRFLRSFFFLPELYARVRGRVVVDCGRLLAVPSGLGRAEPGNKPPVRFKR